MCTELSYLLRWSTARLSWSRVKLASIGAKADLSLFSAEWITTNIHFGSDQELWFVIEIYFICVIFWFTTDHFFIFSYNSQVGSILLNVAHDSMAIGTEEKMLSHGHEEPVPTLALRETWSV